jgi:predicted thioesterase
VAIEKGLQAALVHVVTDADTAVAMGSGDVPVLGTPRLVALAEAACVAALGTGSVASGTTTVGTQMAIDHLLPVAVGETVRVSARLVEVTGRRLQFDIEVTDDGDRLIATSRATRVLVDRSRFLSRAGH